MRTVVFNPATLKLSPILTIKTKRIDDNIVEFSFTDTKQGITNVVRGNHDGLINDVPYVKLKIAGDNDNEKWVVDGTKSIISANNAYDIWMSLKNKNFK